MTDKAEVKEWSLILYGTETEPGQPVSPQQGSQSPDDSHTSDPAVHQSIDTTEGKTETRDPDSMGVGHSSAAAASPTPTPQTLQLTAIKKALPPGCSRVDAAGACIGLCLVVVVVHLVVGGILVGQPNPQKVLCAGGWPELPHGRRPLGEASVSAGTLVSESKCDLLQEVGAADSASPALLQQPTLLVRCS